MNDLRQIKISVAKKLRKFISGLVLGAGASQRLGGPKQLLPYRNSTLLGWVVSQAQSAKGLDEVMVVLGRAADQIRAQVDFGPAKVIENSEFVEGCSSSYRAGIGSLNADSDAVMIILGDQPGIEPDLIDTIAEEWRQSGRAIALCSYRGKLGHPMIFARSLFPELMALHGDKAAWKLVDANPEMVQEIPINLPFPDDINTYEDFAKLETAELTERSN